MKILKKFILYLTSCLIISTPHKAMGADLTQAEHDNRARLNAVPREHRMYVLVQQDMQIKQKIHLINTEDHTRVSVGMVMEGESIKSIHHLPVNNSLYILYMRGISIMDLNTHEILKTVSFEDSIYNVLHDSNNHRMYIRYINGNRLSVMDLNTHEVINNIDLQHKTYNWHCNPFNDCMYVLDRNGCYISIIDFNTHQNIKTLLFFKKNYSEAFPTPYESFCYPACNLFNGCLYVNHEKNLSVINPAHEVIKGIFFNVDICTTKYNPSNQCMYVLFANSKKLSVINPDHEVIEAKKLDHAINRIAYNPSNQCMYAWDWGNNYLSIISPNHKVIETKTLDHAINSIKYNPFNQCMYAWKAGEQNLSIINPDHEDLKTITFDHSICSMEYNPLNGCMYITQYDTRSLSTLNPDHTSHTVNMPFKITDMVFPEPETVVIPTKSARNGQDPRP